VQQENQKTTAVAVNQDRVIASKWTISWRRGERGQDAQNESVHIERDQPKWVSWSAEGWEPTERTEGVPATDISPEGGTSTLEKPFPRYRVPRNNLTGDGPPAEGTRRQEP